MPSAIRGVGDAIRRVGDEYGGGVLYQAVAVAVADPVYCRAMWAIHQVVYRGVELPLHVTVAAIRQSIGAGLGRRA